MNRIIAGTRGMAGGWRWLVLGAVLALLAGGCQELAIQTVPPDTIVTVRDASGQVQRMANSPVRMTVSFDGGRKYVIEASPTEGAVGNYQTATYELTAVTYAALPGSEKNKTLQMKLEPKTYAPIRTVRLILDPISGWVGEVTEERAFREVAELGGAVPTLVVDFTEDLSVTGITISPDGTRLVFAATSYEVKDLKELKALRLDEHRELPIRASNLQGVRTTGGGVQHITDENFHDLFPAFTPDGKFLLFCSNRRRTNSTDILRTSAEGRSGVSNIYIDQRNARAVKPTQASDGTAAFALYPEGWSKPGDVQIWTIGGPNQFPTQIALGVQPAISPDGKHIAYIGVDGNLWVVNADGSNATQLTGGADRILQRFKESVSGVERAQYEYYEKKNALLRFYNPYSFPSWSPDGQQILFSSMEGSDPTGRPNDDIWIMDGDGGNRQQLTTNGSADRFPLMSPDMKYIYFYSNRGMKWAIWRIPVPASATVK